MSARNLAGHTAIVTGASRGFGRSTAIALAGLGARVVGVARSEAALDELRDQLGEAFVPEVADVTEPGLPGRLIAAYRPQALVLNAGATPPVGSLTEQTWETFSTNWNVDVEHVFHFVQEALRAPLDPGSVVVSLSSGAALPGSPMSGGYAGAKATITFISSYAGLASRQSGSGIRFLAVLPQLTPATDLGRTYTKVYAAQAGLSEATLVEDRFGGELSAEQAGQSICELVTDDSYGPAAYRLAASGLHQIE
ncbi:MAG TPA: SDR family oxidoreductase [Acidimicrobiales bacterium]|jgi:NAD(P)-dependent dehydrogenase (short-subunit alcohol dehydrogenase family)|nr:SDR family oxidoreductase [Acidimicrobiales bacterium]